MGETFSQDNTGKNVLSVQELGAFYMLCCLPPAVVRGGILERLSSSLEMHKHYRYCSEAEELLAGASCWDRAHLAPQEEEWAAVHVNAAQPALLNDILPAALIHSFEEMAHCQPWEWLAVQVVRTGFLLTLSARQELCIPAGQRYKNLQCMENEA